MSAGAIAALIAAGAFVLLVLLLAIPLLKLGRVMDEATIAIRRTHESSTPLLAETQQAVSSVNVSLEQLDAISRNVNSLTSNVSALTSVAAATLGSPMIKLAAFTYGVRKTVHQRRDQQTLRSARKNRKR